jgi:hypothetical protein
MLFIKADNLILLLPFHRFIEVPWPTASTNNLLTKNHLIIWFVGICLYKLKNTPLKLPFEVVVMLLYLLKLLEWTIDLLKQLTAFGLVVWFSLRVRQVRSSILGMLLFCYLFSYLIFHISVSFFLLKHISVSQQQPQLPYTTYN